MSLIAFAGRLNSGKDTAGQVFVDLGYNKMAFADPIKEFALSLGFDHCNVYGTQEDKMVPNKDWGLSGREFMQKIGTNLFRNQSILPNIWVKALEIKIKKHPRPIVVTDLRFPDEAEMIRRNGGIIILIKRNQLEIDSHVSENSLDQIVPDLVVENNGSLTQLQKKLREIATTFSVHNL